MKFRDRIPSTVLTGNPNAEKFINVLDATREYKEKEVMASQRFYSPVLLGNLNLLRKKVVDYGYPEPPTSTPKEILDNMILNAEQVMALKGSRLGLRLWLWVMTVGDVTVDGSAFYPILDYIIPDDYSHGYTDDFTVVGPSVTIHHYLFDQLDNFGTQELIVDIATPYDTNTDLKEYIEENIYEFLTFVSEGATITINFTNGPYVTNSEPYQYFVKP